MVRRIVPTLAKIHVAPHDTETDISISQAQEQLSDVNTLK